MEGRAGDTLSSPTSSDGPALEAGGPIIARDGGDWGVMNPSVPSDLIVYLAGDDRVCCNVPREVTGDMGSGDSVTGRAQT